MSVNKRFSLISRTHISKSQRRFNVKSSKYYFHMKTKIMAVFQISISVPLNSRNTDYLYPSYHNFCVCVCVCVCLIYVLYDFSLKRVEPTISAVILPYFY